MNEEDEHDVDDEQGEDIIEEAIHTIAVV